MKLDKSKSNLSLMVNLLNPIDYEGTIETTYLIKLFGKDSVVHDTARIAEDIYPLTDSEKNTIRILSKKINTEFTKNGLNVDKLILFSGREVGELNINYSNDDGTPQDFHINLIEDNIMAKKFLSFCNSLIRRMNRELK